MDTLLIHIPGHTVHNSLFFLFITKVLGDLFIVFWSKRSQNADGYFGN